MSKTIKSIKVGDLVSIKNKRYPSHGKHRVICHSPIDGTFTLDDMPGTFFYLDELELVLYDELSNLTQAVGLRNDAEKGKKNDIDKPDLSLLPRVFLEGTAKAFMHGEKKYGRYNYRSGMDWHRLVGAALRHINAFNDGEDTDPESGNHHLYHAAASLAMLITYTSEGLGKDTRHASNKK